MSEFKVTLEKIKEVKPHNNADRLEIASLDGMLFQFVVEKGVYKTGDYVLYFPVDSLVPPRIQELLKVTGKLSGREKNRIKTIRLRGEYSQGMVAPPSVVFAAGLIREGKQDTFSALDGFDYAPLLGITKYEPPLTGSSGRAVTLPLSVPVYDLESVQRKLRVWESMATKEILVTEKLEGTHFSYSLIVDAQDPSKCEVAICSRRQRLERQETESGEPLSNIYLDAAERFNVHEILAHLISHANKELYTDIAPAVSIHDPTKIVYTLRGELIGPGIQGNIYGLKSNELRFFDFSINNCSLPMVLHEGLGDHLLAPHVEFLRGGESSTIDPVAFSNGQSVLASVKREGVVYQVYAPGGQVLKVRSPEYLAENDL